MNKDITIFKNNNEHIVVRRDAVTHIESRGKWTTVHFISGKTATVELSIESVTLRLWNVQIPQESD